MSQKIQQSENTAPNALHLLKTNLPLIGLFGLLGMLFSAIRLAQTPELYEARGLIQMAQLITNANIEEPASLIQRLRFPSTYPEAVQQSCEMPRDAQSSDYLNGTLEIGIVKNVPSAVELKVRAPSITQVKLCADALAAMIVAQHKELIEDRMNGRQEQLLRYKESFREESRLLEAVKNPVFSTITYLARLDRISWLRSRIDALEEEALLAQKHPAKLITPINVPSKPIPRNATQKLLLGGFLGLILGMLFTLGRGALRKMSL